MTQKQDEKKSVFSILAEDYPLLYLNPDEDDTECYRRVVLRGEEPAGKSLGHYRGSAADRLDKAETPVGPVRVVTLGNRGDFERVVRGLMAAKEGPETKIPESQGAAMLYVFNWRRIHTHLASFPAELQDGEFRRFISVKSNYLDMLVVLSRGPYSHVSAETAGFQEKEWLEYSDTIRRYHELTHVVCRRMYPENIDPLRDELIADAVGLAAAFGRFDPELEKLFLGISGERYTGGRLGNYTGEPDRMAARICEGIRCVEELAGAQEQQDSFGLIPVLMSRPLWKA